MWLSSLPTTIFKILAYYLTHVRRHGLDTVYSLDVVQHYLNVFQQREKAAKKEIYINLKGEESYEHVQCKKE